MKRCNYCGKLNDDSAATCSGCGTADFPSNPEMPVQTPVQEAPKAPPAFAESRGEMLALRCRSPGEALLVADELEKADILAILPPEESLENDWTKNGFVEVVVSAKSYKIAEEVRKVVEFQHRVPPVDQPLAFRGKVMALFFGFLIFPGALVYIFLAASYKEHGFHRMAREFRFWFLFGLGLMLLIPVFSVLLA